MVSDPRPADANHQRSLLSGTLWNRSRSFNEPPNARGSTESIKQHAHERFPPALGNFNEHRPARCSLKFLWGPRAKRNILMSDKVTAQVGDKQIIIGTGKLAKQADGAVTVQLGETIVIVAAVAATKAKAGQDFFPLTVDYREKAAAAGRFPGGYFKREGRPTEKEILTSRLTDRPIRPLFPKGWYNEVQVQSIVLSADGENDPDILSLIGASAALLVSDIPWDGPLGAVRVGRINGQFLANPTHSQMR